MAATVLSDISAGDSIILPLVIFQLKSRIEKNTSINIQKRRVIEQTIPLLVTGTGCPKHKVYRNQGTGSLKQRTVSNLIQGG